MAGLPVGSDPALRRAGGDGVGAGAPLERSFYARPTDEVAPDLLGMVVVRELDGGGVAVGRIVETEAYGGPLDLASHARAGLTRRTAPMHGPVGHAYVYLVYGMHHCLNVVARADAATAGAVLIRALEPLAGIEAIRARRGRPHEADARLMAGPARLCQALSIDRRLDALDLTTGSRLWLATADERPTEQVASGARIGVGYASDDWSARPWRFWLSGNPAVSR